MSAKGREILAVGLGVLCVVACVLGVLAGANPGVPIGRDELAVVAWISAGLVSRLT